MWMSFHSTLGTMQRLTMQYSELHSSSDIGNNPCKIRSEAVDANFQEQERFFHRISRKMVDQDGHPLPQCFVVAEDGVSVNRAKYSRARCVLCNKLYNFRYPLNGSAVAQFPYSALPSGIFPDVGRCHTEVRHTPRVWNYAHCDLKLLRHGREIRPEAKQGLLDRIAEKELLQRLCDAASVVQQNSLPACDDYQTP